MKYRTLIFFILITTNVYAAEIKKDYLQPDISIFTGFRNITDYYSEVVKLFSKAYGPTVRIRTVVLPSFATEYVVGIRERDNKYYAFKLSAKRSVWAEYYQRTQEKTISDKSNQAEIEVQENETEISQQVYKYLADSWRKMLLRTKFPEEKFGGLDGISYHFSSYEMRAGWAWSPDPNSQTGYLVKLAELLGQLAESKESKAIEKNILNTATRLMKTL